MPSSFFCKTTAANVWKTVIGVSAAGAKRGRGKGLGRAFVKDLNKGQIIGVGTKRLVLGGLNSDVTVANKPVEIHNAGVNEEFKENLTQIRQRMSTYIKKREAPLDRGWSGRKAHGRRAGEPDPHDDTPFEGFDSTVLMLRATTCMTGLKGRFRRMHGLVVTGNGNGLAGFATSIGPEPKSVVRRARNRAGQALVSIPRWDNHTVLHDFFSKYYFTTVFVSRKPKGYGVRAHRIIKAICKAFGITDLHAKLEGNTSNQINITKAFFLGLMNQRKYDDMAEEKRLHLVDMRNENFYYPTVLASPKSPIRSELELKKSAENLDFTYFVNQGKIKEVKGARKNLFESLPSWQKHLDKQDYVKNREKTKLLLAAKYGDTKVLDVFPYFRTTAQSFKEK